MKALKYGIFTKFSIFIYILLSLVYFELFLNFLTIKTFNLSTISINLIFIVSLSLIVYGLSKLFKEKLSFLVVSILLFMTSIIYISQIIYYDVFKTFYTIYSLLNSKQVLEVKTTAMAAIMDNLINLIIIFIPFLLFLFLYKRFDSKKNLKLSLITLLLALIVHFAGVGIIYLTPNKSLSIHDFYFNVHEPNSTVENLGLLNYMRLDIKNNILGVDLDIVDKPPTNIEDPIVEEPPATNDESPIPEEAEEEFGYNIMDINFEKLIENEENEELKTMHKYFSNVTPTRKNDHTGIFKDYNLILLTGEAFSHLAIDKDVTPTLYKMVHEGYNFTNFYTPIWGVSTSDGEYVANTGLIPKSGVWSFKESSNNNMYFSLGNRLKDLGYSTRAYHNHTYTFYDRDQSHPNMGYNYKGLGNGLDVTPTWPESDLEMMELTLGEYIDDEPFHTYYMTVSGHMLYSFNDNFMSAKNREFVEHLDLSEAGKAYLAANIELDRALEYLLEQLEEKGIAENTLIALSSDHYPYGLEKEEIEELEGKSIDDNFEIYRNAFLVYAKGMEPEVIEKPASSLDIIPTIYNLLGLEYDSRLFMGRDIFSESKPLVIFLNRSFITDKGRFSAKTKEFISSNGDLDEGYIGTMNDIISAKFYYSAKILELDYYNRIFNEE